MPAQYLACYAAKRGASPAGFVARLVRACMKLRECTCSRAELATCFGLCDGHQFCSAAGNLSRGPGWRDVGELYPDTAGAGRGISKRRSHASTRQKRGAPHADDRYTKSIRAHRISLPLPQTSQPPPLVLTALSPSSEDSTRKGQPTQRSRPAATVTRSIAWARRGDSSAGDSSRPSERAGEL